MGLTNVPEFESLRSRAAKLKIQVPIVKALGEALKSKDMEEMLQVVNLVKKHKLNEKPENWIKEMDGELKYTELEQAIELEKVEIQRKKDEKAQKEKEKEEERARLK